MQSDIGIVELQKVVKQGRENNSSATTPAYTSFHIIYTCNKQINIHDYYMGGGDCWASMSEPLLIMLMCVPHTVGGRAVCVDQ